MAAEATPSSNNNNNNQNAKNKKRRQRYLPHNRPVRKGSYPLRPGVQGFFLTCDGGRERQAANEAVNLLDTFYEELLDGNNSGAKCRIVPSKPLNKITRFADSDSSSSDEESQPDKEDEGHGNKSDELHPDKDGGHENDAVESHPAKEDECHGNEADGTEETPAKKQRLETEIVACGNINSKKTEEKSIDKLLEDELEELGDRKKRHFVSLDCGCTGVIFVQMNKKAGDPGPAKIVEHLMSTAASTRKHMSRFILRLLPVEVTCYASEEEISKAIKPLIAQYFPAETQSPQKFAVLFEARANTGIQRMPIIDAVAKSVPLPHKVDLSNPDKTIIVQIAKTICSVGVVERYKELSKYNLRQLTSPKS